MSLLHEIMKSIADGDPLGSALIKTKLLANRLDSVVLEDWVSHELEGYPEGAEVPDYRVAEIHYSGHFTDGRVMYNDQPVPSSVIRGLAGEEWVRFPLRDGIHSIDDAVKSKDKRGKHLISGSAELQVRYGDKIFSNLNCLRLFGEININAFRKIDGTVRTKLLDLLMKIEKQVPSAVDVTITSAAKQPAGTEATVTKIVNQTIYGGVTGVVSAGDSVGNTVNVVTNDLESMIEALTDSGVTYDDALEFSAVVQEEGPAEDKKSLGPRAKEWAANNIGKAISGGWKIGVGAAEKLLTQAALKYWGLG